MSLEKFTPRAFMGISVLKVRQTWVSYEVFFIKLESMDPVLS